jgi:hypothetical protein
MRSCRAVRGLLVGETVGWSSASWCLEVFADTVCRARMQEVVVCSSQKQAADEVAGGLEDHESGHKLRGWDALAPHRRRGTPITSCIALHLTILLLHVRRLHFAVEMRMRWVFSSWCCRKPFVVGIGGLGTWKQTTSEDTYFDLLISHS